MKIAWKWKLYHTEIGCPLWVEIMFFVAPQLLHCCLQYHAILDHRKCPDYIYINWEYWSIMLKIKHYLRHENKVNENKILSYCKASRCETIKTNKKVVFFMSNLQAYHHFKLDFQIVDQHTGGKWLILGIKRHKDNQLQSLETPFRIS